MNQWMKKIWKILSTTIFFHNDLPLLYGSEPRHIISSSSYLFSTLLICLSLDGEVFVFNTYLILICMFLDGEVWASKEWERKGNDNELASTYTSTWIMVILIEQVPSRILSIFLAFYEVVSRSEWIKIISRAMIRFWILEFRKWRVGILKL